MYSRWLALKDGWNASPRSPCSDPATTFADTSRNEPGWRVRPLTTRTVPPRWTMNNRPVPSPALTTPSGALSPVAIRWTASWSGATAAAADPAPTVSVPSTTDATATNVARERRRRPRRLVGMAATLPDDRRFPRDGRCDVRRLHAWAQVRARRRKA